MLVSTSARVCTDISIGSRTMCLIDVKTFLNFYSGTINQDTKLLVDVNGTNLEEAPYAIEDGRRYCQREDTTAQRVPENI